jgi:hypothetical protein
LGSVWTGVGNDGVEDEFQGSLFSVSDAVSPGWVVTKEHGTHSSYWHLIAGEAS